MARSKGRVIDKNSFSNGAEDFIPIACHYNDTTLLTKNGELIQTILINGINSETISDKLMNLREILREAISETVTNEKFAFWIHTVRRKTNLDDPTKYDQYFSGNLHKIWQQKNFWHDKFVNVLYITIVFSGPNFNINSLKGFIASISYYATKKFYNNHLEKSYELFNDTVNKLLEKLKVVGAAKLSINYDKDGCYSDLLLLYSRIVHLYEHDKILLPLTDLSNIFSKHLYAVGNNKIQVIHDDHKKFATILSIKEYQEISAEKIDNFLQGAIEFISTEAFYFIPKAKAVSYIEYQNYLLTISNDSELANLKGTTDIIQAEGANSVCTQQISIMVISDSVEKLEQDTRKASEALSKIGILHVREDIKLEDAFWSQLPGNFTFLKRLVPSLTKNIGSFASLHNFPTGKQESKWGKAVTIFRTEKGTPYFMSFHTNSGGHTAIYGVSGSGKSVMKNFLISEATKFNPAILYLCKDTTPKIFIKALEGDFIGAEDEGFNILLASNNDLNIIKKIIKAICGVEDADEKGELFCTTISNYIYDLPYEERDLRKICDQFNFEEVAAENYKNKLKIITDHPFYRRFFTGTKEIEISPGKIQAIVLDFLTEKDFEKKNFTSDPRLRDQYNSQVNILKKIRYAVILYLVSIFVNTDDENPKILVVDSFFEFFDDPFNSEEIEKILKSISAKNGILLTSINLDYYDSFMKEEVKSVFNKYINTEIILSSEIILDNIAQILKFSKAVFKKYKTLKPFMRLFIIRQEENTLVAELSLEGIPAVLKILSSGSDSIELFEKILQEEGTDLTTWLPRLYEELNND